MGKSKYITNVRYWISVNKLSQITEELELFVLFLYQKFPVPIQNILSLLQHQLSDISNLFLIFCMVMVFRLLFLLLSSNIFPWSCLTPPMLIICLPFAGWTNFLLIPQWGFLTANVQEVTQLDYCKSSLQGWGDCHTQSGSHGVCANHVLILLEILSLKDHLGSTPEVPPSSPKLCIQPKPPHQAVIISAISIAGYYTNPGPHGVCPEYTPNACLAIITTKIQNLLGVATPP